MLHRRTLPGVLRLLPAAVFLVSTAVADDSASLPFSNDDVPTVLTATRLQQPLLDVPAAVTVIDRQMIEQSGVREIPELLRLVPGMVVGYDSGYEAFVSYHGTSADLARRMQVLVDGRSIYQPLLASVDWLGMPLELADIERIEVIRGPNSAAWGANSFFAVVNIVTRHPADVERARISYTRGNGGIEDFLARLAMRTAGLDWRLTVAGRSDDGFEKNLDPAKQAAGLGEFTDSKKVRSVNGRINWSSEADSSLELAFGLSGMDAQQQYRPTFFLEPPVAERENKFASLAWEQNAGADNRVRLQAAHSRFRREEPWLVGLPRASFRPDLVALYELNRDCANGLFWPPLDGDPPDASACSTAQELALANSYVTAVGSDPMLWLFPTVFRSGLDAHERRTTVDLQDTWSPSADFRTVFGVTYDNARVDSQVYLGGFGENTVWRTFAHGEWRLAPAWLLNVGGNGEFDEGAGDFFSPRYALNWQFTPGQVLRLVYSEAVRTPD
ncbi:MAG: TonB-dependent receptor plug, partial [Moraxellaceae bacterium]|nr:TonB-dependent receptor plug [Moraxellaceae bacterium]